MNEILIYIYLFFLLIPVVAVSFIPGKGTSLVNATARVFSGAYILFTISLAYLFNVTDFQRTLNLLSLENFYSIQIVANFGGLSFVFLFLNAVALFLAVFNISKDESNSKLKVLSYICISWLSSIIFVSHSLYSMFLFWELLIFPLFIVVSQEDVSIFSKKRLLILNSLSAAIILCVIIYTSSKLYKLDGTYNLTIESLAAMSLRNDGLYSPSSLIFWSLILSVFLRCGFFPFHSIYSEILSKSSIPTKMIIIGLVTKVGIFVTMKLLLVVFPDLVNQFSYILISLGLIGLLYLSFFSIGKENIESQSFLALSTLLVCGLFSNSDIGLRGTVIYTIAHALTFSLLVLVVDATNKRQSLANCKVLKIFYLVPILITLFLPGGLGFSGLFGILYSLIKYNIYSVLIVVTGIFIIYYYLHRSYFSSAGYKNNNSELLVQDISSREIVSIAFLLIILITPESVWTFMLGI